MLKKIIYIPTAEGHEENKVYIEITNSAETKDRAIRQAEAVKLFNVLLEESSSFFFNDLAKLFYDYAMVKKGERGKVIDTETMMRFDKFWEEYPNRPSRSKALESFVSLKLNQKTFSEVMDGLRINKAMWTKNNTEKKYIPHPTTWLNQRRWEPLIDNRPKENKSTVSDIMSQVLNEKGL